MTNQLKNKVCMPKHCNLLLDEVLINEETVTKIEYLFKGVVLRELIFMWNTSKAEDLSQISVN